MIQLDSPKSAFLRSESEAKRFHEIASDPLVHKAIGIVMAELALQGLSGAEIDGAGRFAKRFLNLAEKEEVIDPLPVKALTTYGPWIGKPKPDA